MLLRERKMRTADGPLDLARWKIADVLNKNNFNGVCFKERMEEKDMR